jgi:hypothetical protein
MKKIILLLSIVALFHGCKPQNDSYELKVMNVIQTFAPDRIEIDTIGNDEIFKAIGLKKNEFDSLIGQNRNLNHPIRFKGVTFIVIAFKNLIYKEENIEVRRILFCADTLCRESGLGIFYSNKYGVVVKQISRSRTEYKLDKIIEVTLKKRDTIELSGLSTMILSDTTLYPLPK